MKASRYSLLIFFNVKSKKKKTKIVNNQCRYSKLEHSFTHTQKSDKKMITL